MRACGRRCGCRWRPGALWRVEPRPLCRRRRTSARVDERARGWQRERKRERTSPGGCVETPARTVVMSKSRPHPVWTPTPTLAQSSRGDHRALPAGIFVINDCWPRQPSYNSRTRHHSTPPWRGKDASLAPLDACERVGTVNVYPCLVSRLYSEFLPCHILAPDALSAI